MPAPRTSRRWPYKAGKPADGPRVIKKRERRDRRPPFVITRTQARIGFAAAVAFTLLSAAWYSYRSPWLTVSHIEVRGASQVSVERVIDASGLDGDSIFRLDLEAARERVGALQNVSDVHVEKVGLNDVRITIEERTAWGSWQIDGVNVPIDEEGYVLDAIDAPPAGAAVIVEVEPHRVLNPGDRVDAGAVELAVRLTQEADTAFGREVVALLYRQNSGITAVLSGGDIDAKPVWVTFGDSRDYDYKIATLYVLFERAKEERLALNAVDLRFGDRVSFN
jgi:hypothetical protein